MKKAVVVLFAVVACGGSSTSIESKVVGRWNGAFTLSLVGSNSGSYSDYLEVTDLGNGEISLGGFCLNNGHAGPTATMTSATTFSSQAFNCPPIQSSSCSSLIWSLEPGSGSLLPDGTLQATLTGTGSGCGLNWAYTISFGGHQ
jgi:hypothetical protein